MAAFWFFWVSITRRNVGLRKKTLKNLKYVLNHLCLEVDRRALLEQLRTEPEMKFCFSHAKTPV